VVCATTPPTYLIYCPRNSPLYQSALVASTRNKDFIEYFSRLIAGRERERGIKTKMRVKVAAKMLVIAWTIWKNEEVFQGKYLLQQ